MGNKNAYGDPFLDNVIVTKSLFEFIDIIGRGGFGKVWKVKNRKYKIYFAMKEMSKKAILDKKSIKGILYERELLSKMNHPFLVNMHFSFQDNNYIYIVMDLLTGGDLRYYITTKKRRFNEEETRFIIANLILALEYIHANNIIHRDIKPENLVFDKKGYIHLTDFGIAKLFSDLNDKDYSGTPAYMAPEMLFERNYNVAADYYALGIMCYELIRGRRPYGGRNRKEIKEKVEKNQMCLTRNDIPKGWSIESADFINKCIQRNPSKRLGIHGIHELKNHPWFKYYIWKNIYLKKDKAPFIPAKKDNYDKAYCNVEDNIGVKTKARYLKIEKDPNYSTAFKEFKYFNRYSQTLTVNIEKYINPHEIYDILEEKERKAFGDQNDKNSSESEDENEVIKIIKNKFNNKEKLTLKKNRSFIGNIKKDININEIDLNNNNNNNQNDKNNINNINNDINDNNIINKYIKNNNNNVNNNVNNINKINNINNIPKPIRNNKFLNNNENKKEDNLKKLRQTSFSLKKRIVGIFKINNKNNKSIDLRFNEDM